jgi:hypothetical protein
MTQETDVNWPKCDQAGCIGIRLDAARMCLAHATEEERAAALKLVGQTGSIDVRGVPIAPALLEQVLTVVPLGTNSQPLIRDCRFDQATFSGDAEFGGTTFTGNAWFDEATFSGNAWFGGATFSGDAGFGGATFTGDAGFGGTTFSGNAGFGEATFTGDAWFGEATFSGNAWFDEATFKRQARFGRATFTGDTRFGGATFTGDARFDGATFTGDASFGGTTCKRQARFDGVMFEQARQFGPLLAHRGLILNNVQFAQPVQIEVSTTGLFCRRARFPGGVQFQLRWACVVLDDADLSSPSIVTGVPPRGDPGWFKQERRIVEAWRRLLADEISERPQLLSVRRANVAGLGLSNVSAADCRFAGAHNLECSRFYGHRIRLPAD